MHAGLYALLAKRKTSRGGNATHQRLGQRRIVGSLSVGLGQAGFDHANYLGRPLVPRLSSDLLGGKFSIFLGLCRCGHGGGNSLGGSGSGSRGRGRDGGIDWGWLRLAVSAVANRDGACQCICRGQLV